MEVEIMRKEFNGTIQEVTVNKQDVPYLEGKGWFKISKIKMTTEKVN
jgi:hypothetical protein